MLFAFLIRILYFTLVSESIVKHLNFYNEAHSLIVTCIAYVHHTVLRIDSKSTGLEVSLAYLSQIDVHEFHKFEN